MPPLPTFFFSFFLLLLVHPPPLLLRRPQHPHTRLHPHFLRRRAHRFLSRHLNPLLQRRRNLLVLLRPGAIPVLLLVAAQRVLQLCFHCFERHARRGCISRSRARLSSDLPAMRFFVVDLLDSLLDQRVNGGGGKQRLAAE
ncbi:hypothetical protein BDV95DRAFT_584613 [Massariosphaeria phaeospora]|uniref:Secreted protein n=1 Tax=Massariosphaeria phaeospora TaxID=100035 RepID=A0A7C8M2L8_9PLEO|nr:hypothetical protein BDV95DRAFT_584613 [Massariosphaeria phaeospora]